MYNFKISRESVVHVAQCGVILETATPRVEICTELSLSRSNPLSSKYVVR